MSTNVLGELLSEEQQIHFEAILQEIEPLVEIEDYAQAIHRLEMIVNTVPVDQDNRLLRAVMLAKLGELHIDADDNETGEEFIRHAMHNGARHWGVYILAGWAHSNLDETAKARSFFDRALAENPNAIDALIGRAFVLQDLDELELAKADLTHAIGCDGSRASLYAMRGEVALKLGEVEGAERDLVKAHELDPEDGDFAIALARFRAATGKLEEALELIDEALADDDDISLDALLLRSHLRLVNGRTRQARADAINASNRFPDEAFAFVQLAHVQLSQGNSALALKAAERAVKLDSSLPDSYLVRGQAFKLKGDETGADADFKRASRAPVELPIFLFGAAYEAMEDGDFNASIQDAMNAGRAPASSPSEAPNPFAGMPGMPGLPGLGGMGAGMDPMKMMNQLFDDQGNIRGPFKPFVDMALKNAPTILKNMPPGLLKSMGGIDPEMLKNMDLDQISPEELESQMKEFAKMVKSGENPAELAKRAQEELKRQQNED